MKYSVLLNGKLFAKTNFEFADPPMGIVFGKIEGITTTINYAYLKKISTLNSAELVFDYPEDQLISVRGIELTVINEAGEVLSEDNSMIEGMDSDYFTITIRLSYPKYEDEFPHHVATYKNAFE